MHADADLKKDLKAKLQRLVEEERVQSRLRDEHPSVALSLPLQAGEVLRNVQAEFHPVAAGEGDGTPGAHEGDDHAQLLSLGTRGHPSKCRPVCRFFRRSRGGCRDGAACKYCHACALQEPERRYIGVALHGTPFSAGPVPPGAMQRSTAESSEFPSMGSFGHPLSCAPPCKYNSKSKGCKDGSLCDHCHLCRWKRHGPPGGGYTSLDARSTSKEV